MSGSCAGSSKALPTWRCCEPPSPGVGACAFAAEAEQPDAPVIWCPEISPSTIILVPAPPGFDGAAPLDFASAGPILADRRNGDDRHLVLGEPAGDHRLWLHGTDAAARPAILLPIDGALELRVEALWRFYRRLRGRLSGPPPRALQPTPLQRARLILLLQTLDLRLDGAGPRDIAAALLDAEAATLPAVEWKSSATRRKANRLISDALALMNGGYSKLLRGG